MARWENEDFKGMIKFLLGFLLIVALVYGVIKIYSHYIHPVIEGGPDGNVISTGP